MPNLVWKIPVAKPAIQPAQNATSILTHTFRPLDIHNTMIAPPVPIEPSTERSATSSTRKVIYTPIAMMPQMIPWAAAPGKAAKNEAIFCSP